MSKPKREQDKDSLGFDEFYEPLPATSPTRARPGSVEKIEVLCERAELGQELHHPDDEQTSATWEDQSILHQYALWQARKRKSRG